MGSVLLQRFRNFIGRQERRGGGSSIFCTRAEGDETSLFSDRSSGSRLWPPNGFSYGTCSYAGSGDIQFFPCWVSAAVGGTRAGKTEPQEEQQLGAAVHPIFSTLEIPNPLNSFDAQGYHATAPPAQHTFL